MKIHLSDMPLPGWSPESCLASQLVIWHPAFKSVFCIISEAIFILKSWQKSLKKTYEGS